MTELIGQTLGSYVIEELIEASRSGQLFRARQVRLDRPAGLKVLDARLTAAPGFATLFRAAMRGAAALQHPHIVQIEDFGEQGGRFYVAMELLGGGSLGGLLARHAQTRAPWPLATGLDVIRQAADGLAYAHGQGAVHGGIAPESLLLQQRDAAAYTLTIGDWGLASLDGDEPIVAPAYLSPEQCRGLAPDARSDIYALGVVLYQVCTGFVPFAVKTRAEAAEKHLRAQPTPPRIVRPELPAELEAIILRCLAKQPEQRFATAGALAAALGQVLRAISPAQTILLGGAATRPIATPPAAPQQPTLVAPMTSTPSSQPTVSAGAALPQVQAIDPQGRIVRVVDLPRTGLTVGRAADSDLALEHEQVSRQHLRIDWDGRQVTATDLGSSNRTLLGGRPLTPHVATPWDWRETARVGPFTLKLAPQPGSAAQRAAPAATAGAADPLLTNLLGAAVQAVPATQAIGAGRIGVQLGQAQLAITPGQPAVVYVTLTNQGATADELAISVEGVPGAWVIGPDQPVQVAPGGRATAAITVNVPRAPESLAGDYPVIVRARSAASQAESGTARGRWTVLPFAASSLALSPRRAEGRDAASYQVTVRNEGNATAAYLLGAEDEQQALDYAFAQDQLTLDPGQAAAVALTVYGPRRLIGSPQTRQFTVRADTAGEPAQAVAQFVQQPLIPIWAAALALALVLALALLFASRNRAPAPPIAGGTTTAIATLAPTLAPTLTPTAEPGAPVVAAFTVDPQIGAPGQVVTVTWDVQNAEQVTIDQFGDVPPQGQRTFRPEQTTDFRLVATGGGKTTTRIERVSVAPATPTSAPTAAATATPTAPPAPSATATPVPPAPSATATPVPPLPPPVNLIDAAPSARWSTDAGPIRFGAPINNVERGGWADLATNQVLEDGKEYPMALYTVPTTGTGSFIEGQFDIPAIQAGQYFLADIGLRPNAQSSGVKVQISFAGELIYEGTKQPSGSLLAIGVDLSRFAGRADRLALRVSGNTGAAQDGLYWIRPRVAGPEQ